MTREVRIDKLTKDEWATLSQDAHAAAFKELRPGSTDRIDFALLGLLGTEVVAYMTVRETDDRSLYLQYGGALGSIPGTVHVLHVYEAMLQKLAETHDRCTTLVSADNVAYLRLAFKPGFRIIGTRTIDGEVFAELYLEF